VGWLRRFIEIVILFVVLPVVALFWAGVVIAVGVKALLIYSGALVAAWIFGAIGLPILFGVVSPREIVEGYRARRRHERFYEGEPLPAARQKFRFWKVRFDGRRSRRRREKFYPREPLRGPREGFPFWNGRFEAE
jgi:hypothetical protein